MLEIILFFILLFCTLSFQKHFFEPDIEIPFLCYTPGFISVKEVEDAMEENQKHTFHAAMLIYTQLKSIMEDDNTVIQFQMFGLGQIWKKGIRRVFSNGPFQLAVALKIISKFRQKFPEISVTSQEPYHGPAEIEYLQNQNIHVFERTAFSPDFFIDGISKCNVSKPIMICYMIHFSIYDFEDFLDAHWTPEILSKIIFVANPPSFWNFCTNYKKVEKFLKNISSHKTLPTVKPTFDLSGPESIYEWEPFFDHPSDFLLWKSFSRTDVYSISFENAKKMIEHI